MSCQKIGLFYGTTTGNTGDAAEYIREEFNKISPDGIKDAVDISDVDASSLADYDALILGISTWDIGEVQYDWGKAIDDMDGLDLSGKKIAIFGLGDQEAYPDTYQDGVGILGEKVRELGAELVGFTSTDGHEFDESRGVENSQFVGLALDEDNQDELSEERIFAWVKELVEAFGL